jgi:hypothetical protein
MAKPKVIHLTPEMTQIIEAQIEAFRKKFQREPDPDDPIFFDPDADTPQPLTEAAITAMFNEVLDAAKRAKLPPEEIYAIRKTGRMVTEKNKQLLSPEDIAEWNAALEEYRSLQ